MAETRHLKQAVVWLASRCPAAWLQWSWWGSATMKTYKGCYWNPSCWGFN